MLFWMEQDCEMNAAKRLLKKIKKDYPRLPICIQGDALYATEPLRLWITIENIRKMWMIQKKHMTALEG